MKSNTITALLQQVNRKGQINWVEKTFKSQAALDKYVDSHDILEVRIEVKHD